ncbi:hypothetical protein Btru_040572 [Bulinus truncatus]|nr:hypothetical protein Btru_040572 [Bulinus truncatus]
MTQAVLYNVRFQSSTDNGFAFIPTASWLKYLSDVIDDFKNYFLFVLNMDQLSQLIPKEEFSFFIKKCPGMTSGQLEVMKNKLRKELECDYFNVDDKIRQFNMQTFIYFQLYLHYNDKKAASSACSRDNIRRGGLLNAGNEESQYNSDSLQKAVECNDQAVLLSKWNNMTSLVYGYHLCKEKDDKDKADWCYEKLVDMMKSPDFVLILAKVKSEMAYTYSRCKCFDSMLKATDFYKEAIFKNPDNYVWKYGLALAHSHIVCRFSTSPKLNKCETNKRLQSAVNLLFETVEKSGDKELCSQSYCQLALLKRFLQNEDLVTEELSKLYREENVLSLVDKALLLEPNNAKTLRDCGRLLNHDPDRAIEVLEKSVDKVEHTAAFHSLGIAYKNKAVNEAKNGKRKFKADIKYTHWKKNKRNVQITCPAVCITLDFDNEYVQKAIDYHKKSIYLVSGQNFPAIYTLGLLLRSCGCTNKAVAQFENIIHASKTSKDGSGPVNLDTQVASHLQLGLCALDKSKPRKDDFNKCRAQMIKAIRAIYSECVDVSDVNSLIKQVNRTLNKLMTSYREKPFWQKGLWTVVSNIFQAFYDYKLCARK